VLARPDASVARAWITPDRTVLVNDIPEDETV